MKILVVLLLLMNAALCFPYNYFDAKRANPAIQSAYIDNHPVVLNVEIQLRETVKYNLGIKKNELYESLVFGLIDFGFRPLTNSDVGFPVISINVFLLDEYGPTGNGYKGDESTDITILYVVRQGEELLYSKKHRSLGYIPKPQTRVWQLIAANSKELAIKNNISKFLGELEHYLSTESGRKIISISKGPAEMVEGDAYTKQTVTQSKNTILVELGGSGVFGSFRYETMLVKDFWLQLGFGFWEDTKSTSSWELTDPYSGSGYWNHGLEKITSPFFLVSANYTGLALGKFATEISSGITIFALNRGTEHVYNVNVGLRYLSDRGRLSPRIGYTMLFSDEDDGEIIGDPWKIQNWAYLSLGYAF